MAVGSTSSSIGSEPATVPSEPIFRLTVAQYHEMIRAGILTEDDPVELLEGWLVTKMPKNPPHSVATRLTTRVLSQCLPSGWEVQTQEPITTDTSEPEPDVSVVRGDARQYTNRHPRPDDVALVVEVADATLARDRGQKKRIYAHAAIPVYWIIILVEQKIEVYSDPTGPAVGPDYRRRQDFGPSQQIPVWIDGNEVGRLTVSDLLP